MQFVSKKLKHLVRTLNYMKLKHLVRKMNYMKLKHFVKLKYFVSRIHLQKLKDCVSMMKMHLNYLSTKHYKKKKDWVLLILNAKHFVSKKYLQIVMQFQNMRQKHLVKSNNYKKLKNFVIPKYSANTRLKHLHFGNRK